MNKDLAPSPEKGINVKDFNVLSREEDGYRSCHLFLSGGDSSSLSVATSPGNVSFEILILNKKFKCNLCNVNT
jgi:hypothetical protein